MKNFESLRFAVVFLILLIFLILGALPTYAQITPSDDAYIDTTKPTANNGTKVTLGVISPSQTTYVRFDLSSIPTGYTSANIAKASLKVYVNTVTTTGSFNVDFVNGTWTESGLAADNAPALGSTIAASVPLTKAQVHDYVVIDVTAALQAWLDGAEANDGLALVANSPLSATFDSKESTTQSHPAELDVVYAGAGGSGITGINTATGSGLMGGGTSGTLNLSLATNCANGQILEWNGNAWACANLTGGGTITGVIAGTDLTGGGTSGNVTLSVDTTQVPQLNFANIFTGSQTVNGNLSATGTVTGSSFGIGSNLFAFGSYSQANSFLGFAGNATSTGAANTGDGYQSLFSNTTGYDNTASGVNALHLNTTGYYNTAGGVDALYTNSTGIFNTASGVNSLYSNTTGSLNTAIGVEALNSNTVSNENTATGALSLYSNNGGTGNTADGTYALYNNTLGNSNVADGEYALYTNTTGNFNTASGSGALGLNTEGGGNTAFGFEAIGLNAVGVENTGIGESVLTNNTTGSYNTAVGAQALFYNVTGTLLTCVGAGCGVADGLTNATAIGAYSAVTQSNSLVLGGTGPYAVRVGIGTAAPSNAITIARGLGPAVSDGWNTYSSRRFKSNIQTLKGALDKVEHLRGVSYDLKANGKHEVGVIAEEVGAVVPEIVTWEEDGKNAQSVDYSRLTALLIEATKEQQALIREQKAQIKAQQAQIVLVTRQVKTIQATLKASGRTRSLIRTVKAQGATVNQ